MGSFLSGPVASKTYKIGQGHITTDHTLTGELKYRVHFYLPGEKLDAFYVEVYTSPFRMNVYDTTYTGDSQADIIKMFVAHNDFPKNEHKILYQALSSIA